MSRDDRYDPTPLRALRPPFLQYPIDAHEPYPNAQLPLPTHDIIPPPAPAVAHYARERALNDFPHPPEHVEPPHALPPDAPPPLQPHHVHALPHSLPLPPTDHPPPMSHALVQPLGVGVDGAPHHGGALPPSHHGVAAVAAAAFQSGVDGSLTAEYGNYSSLVASIARHPSLVLLFKRVFAASGLQQPFEADAQLAEALVCGERKCESVRHCAEISGMQRAVAQFSGVEVVMSALLTALSDVRCGLGAVANPALRQALDTVCNRPRLGVMGAAAAAAAAAAVSGGGGGGVGVGVGGGVVGGGGGTMGVWRDERHIHKGVGSGRTPLSEKAKAALERWFHENLENPYPTIEQKLELARVCSMSLNSVNNWFGNKRMRIKRKMLNVTSGAFDSGSISEKVLAPRSKWQAVVVSKMNGRAGREVVASATGRAGGAFGGGAEEGVFGAARGAPMVVGSGGMGMGGVGAAGGGGGGGGGVATLDGLGGAASGAHGGRLDAV